jgi:uncharacterized protein (TIGR00730 family)
MMRAVLEKNVAVFCGAASGRRDIYKSELVLLGHELGFNGYNLVFGGGGTGCMAHISSSLMMSGGRSYGVITKDLLKIEKPNEDITSMDIVDNMFMRKKQMYHMASAFIVAPGGIGTKDELSEILVHRALDYHNKPIILFNINNFWAGFIKQYDHMTVEGFIHNESRIFDVAETVPEVIELLNAALT